MINRILIRIKVVQMMYSYLLSQSNMSITEAKDELQESLEKGYELYNYMLLLMVQLTDLQEERLAMAKEKYLPTEADLNPNTKLVDNLFIKALADDHKFKEYLKENDISWRNDDVFMKVELDRILKSDIYADYIASEGNDFVEDCIFWHSVMKEIVLKDEELSETLEAKSVYWNDDLTTVGSFVLKTIKLFEQKVEVPIQPMYRNHDDSVFGEELFSYALKDREYNNALIDRFIMKDNNWDSERVALMDRLIMGVALSEVVHFPSIPTRVTLNEYIEIAKYYSTAKSGQFINGILNSAINYLRDSHKINK